MSIVTTLPAMDVLTLRKDRSATPWQVIVLVNGTPLLDLVTAIEEPLVAAEIAQRVAAGDPAEELQSLMAGAYMYPTETHMTGAQAHTFLGRIEDHFVLDDDDPQRGHIIVLGCDCGTIGCWPLIADVAVADDSVTWHHFCQFHRDWRYDGLGPYRFDRAQYDQALRSIH